MLFFFVVNTLKNGHKKEISKKNENKSIRNINEEQKQEPTETESREKEKTKLEGTDATQSTYESKGTTNKENNKGNKTEKEEQEKFEEGDKVRVRKKGDIFDEVGEVIRVEGQNMYILRESGAIITLLLPLNDKTWEIEKIKETAENNTQTKESTTKQNDEVERPSSENTQEKEQNEIEQQVENIYNQEQENKRLPFTNNGKYWNINSDGVFSKRYGNKNKEVWSVSAQQNNVSANVSDDLRSETKADKVSNPNVQSSILSEGKDTIKNGNEVEIEQEKNEDEGIVAIKRRYDRTDKRIGRRATKILPNGEKVRGRFVIVEAEGLTPSHDIERNFAQSKGFPTRADGSTLNDRDYQHDKSAQQQVMTRSLKYDGRAVQDMPIIDKNGIVLSGNDRTMSGQLASKQGTDTEYLEYLSDNAEMYGLTDDQVKEMKHPRLVFELEESMPYTTQSFAIFNANERKTQNNTEKAIKVGKTISEKTIKMIADKFDEYESIAECLQDVSGSKFVIDRLVEDGILQRNDVEELVEERGLLNATGKEFVQTTLLGTILNEESIRMASNMPFIKNIILSSLNEILQNRKLSNKYTLNGEINEAIKVVYEAHKNQKIKQGEVLTLYYSQIDMFTGEANMKELTIQMLADILNGTKVKELKKVLSLYNVDAQSADNGELDMFGVAGSVKTKEQILKDVIKRIKENEQRKSNAKVGRVSNGNIASKESGETDGTESANERERSGHKSQRDNRGGTSTDVRGQQRTIEQERKEKAPVFLSSSTPIADATKSQETSESKGITESGNSIIDEARQKIKERLNKLKIKGVGGLSLEEYYKQAVEKGGYFEKNMTESGKWEYKYFKDANTYTIITKAEYDYAVSIGGKHETAELKDLLLKERAYNRLANKYGYRDAEDIMLSVKEAEKHGLEANAKELWEYYELAKSYDQWNKRLQNYYTYYVSNHFKEVEKQQEIKPIGKGEFGNIYDQFKGKPKEAVEFLKEKKEGEVLEALYNKDVGYIDLVWGKEGTARSDGYGLSKLIKYHPEVVNNLQEIINDMHITKRTENRIQLESDKYKASVRLTWNNERKTWLLTAFQKNSVSDNTTDTDETLKGKRNATATSQNTISNGKDTTKSGTDKEKAEIKKQRALENNEHKVSGEAEQTVSSEEAQLRNAVVEVLSEAIGKENVITDNAEAQRVLDVVNGKDELDNEVRQIDEVNKRFNEDLQKQIEGTLKKDHTYQLGRPSEILQSAGIRDLPIELRSSRLQDKALQTNHPFNLKDIKNLPQAIKIL